MIVGLEAIYEVQIRCSNCNKVQTVKIKKGQLITDYVVGKECPHCGCRTMRYFKAGGVNL